MNVAQIREAFLKYFEAKGHEIVPSAPMVIKNDPTLMFTNAGMNQFKDFFLGNSIPNSKRVANTQKCLRVSGKHNDLEEVGVDTYHHTMFEMLGNWSFGDYFKEESIDWAWDLLTNIYGIDKNRLYVTIFEGDSKDKTELDHEALRIWSKYVDEKEVILCDKKDNFWEMGEMGPCGPCSEIHIDLRPNSEREKVSGSDLVNKDHPQVIEIWNLVFIEFNRKADGSLHPLPNKHVDTGMGLERLAVALQNKKSNYDIDLFQSLIKKTEELSGFKYGEKEDIDIAIRIVSDHIRAIGFSIADGQIPSNAGAGYVIRRILRRGVRYGYQILNLKEPFLCELFSSLLEQMGSVYPELNTQKELIYNVIKEEENSFFRTLEQGIKRMDQILSLNDKKGTKMLSGQSVFELYDTYGFPIDLTSLIAKEKGFEIDIESYSELLQKQKSRSRSASEIQTEDWKEVNTDEALGFVGYDVTESTIKICKVRKVVSKKEELYQLVFNQTPFYPEGGGQVGDQGLLIGSNETIGIIDTKKENNLIVHFTKKIPSDLEGVFTAKVDATKRTKTACNHSATHLLHHALRKVLGDHVEQKGSLVNSKYLRFDFSHFSKISKEELEEIGNIVSSEILKNSPLEEFRSMAIDQAKEMGAMALFGEKYGEKVRVIKFADSVELCGGIHVPSTSKIACFKILSESSIASGIRRIEAITESTAWSYYKTQDQVTEELKTILKNPKDLSKAVLDLSQKNVQLSKELEKLQKEKARGLKKELVSKIEILGDVSFLGQIVDLESSSVKDILFQLKSENQNFVGVLGTKTGAKCTISIALSDQLTKDGKHHAGKIIKELSQLIKGGGGGQSFFATAGGSNPNGLNEAILKAKEIFS